MISLYRPGNSLIHRLTAASKLIGLVFALAFLASKTDEPLIAVARISAVSVLYLVAGLGFKEFFLQMWQIRVLVLLVAVPQIIFVDPVSAAINTVSLVSAVLLATLVSMTTKTSDIVNLIERVTKSRSLALLIALSINSVALVTGYARQIIESSKARGVKPKPVRQMINLFVIALRNADQYGEALAARGVEV